MKRLFCFACIAALVLLLGSGATFGQATASGTIQGTITDKSQSVITGAEVTLTSKATGATRTAASNDEGNFRFDFLSAGTYTVKTSKSGSLQWYRPWRCSSGRP